MDYVCTNCLLFQKLRNSLMIVFEVFERQKRVLAKKIVEQRYFKAVNYSREDIRHIYLTGSSRRLCWWISHSS